MCFMNIACVCMHVCVCVCAYVRACVRVCGVRLVLLHARSHKAPAGNRGRVRTLSLPPLCVAFLSFACAVSHITCLVGFACCVFVLALVVRGNCRRLSRPDVRSQRLSSYLLVSPLRVTEACLVCLLPLTLFPLTDSCLVYKHDPGTRRLRVTNKNASEIASEWGFQDSKVAEMMLKKRLKVAASVYRKVRLIYIPPVAHLFSLPYKRPKVAASTYLPVPLISLPQVSPLVAHLISPRAIIAPKSRHCR